MSRSSFLIPLGVFAVVLAFGIVYRRTTEEYVRFQAAETERRSSAEERFRVLFQQSSDAHAILRRNEVLIPVGPPDFAREDGTPADPSPSSATFDPGK